MSDPRLLGTLGEIERRLDQVRVNIYDLTTALAVGNAIADRAQKVAEYEVLRARHSSALSARLKKAVVALDAELWP